MWLCWLPSARSPRFWIHNSRSSLATWRGVVWVTRDPVSKERWGSEGEEKREARGRVRAGTGKTGEFPPRPACRAVIPGSPSPTFCFCHLWLLEALGDSIYTTDFKNSPVVPYNPDPAGRGSELQNEEAGTCLVSPRHSGQVRARASHPSSLHIEFICGACEKKPRSPGGYFPSRFGSQL